VDPGSLNVTDPTDPNPDPQHCFLENNSFYLQSYFLQIFVIACLFVFGLFTKLLIFCLVQGLEKNVNIETLEVAKNKITSLKGMNYLRPEGILLYPHPQEKRDAIQLLSNGQDT